MVAMANLGIPEAAVRRQIASAIQVVVQLSRMSDGTRKLVNVTEIIGMEGQIVTMQELFVFKKEGLSANKQVLGEFVSTGIRPRFSERLAAAGVILSPALFGARKGYQ